MSYITVYSDLNKKERRQLEYKRRYKAEHPDWDDSMVMLTNLVRERVRPGSFVLDAGCGHGNFVIDELRTLFSSAVGVDADAEATGKNVCLDRVEIGTLDRLPFPDGSFDVVTSLWVLEHLKRPDAAFKEIRRVLKPGGFFAFVTPNKRSLLIGLRRLMTKRIADALLSRIYGREDKDVFEVHYRANSVRALRAIASEAGLHIDVVCENPDPSYTSFDSFTYRLSSVATLLPGPFFRPHLVGVLRRPA